MVRRELSRLKVEYRQWKPLTRVFVWCETLAPEVFRGERYDTKADVYSFAILAWELITQRRPFVDMNPQSAAYHVAVNGLRPEFPGDFPTPLQKMVEVCWGRSPYARPSFQRIFADLSIWLGLATAVWGEDADPSAEATPMVRSTTVVPSVHAHMLSQGVALPAPGSVIMDSPPPRAKPRQPVPLFLPEEKGTTGNARRSSEEFQMRAAGESPSPNTSTSKDTGSFDLPDYDDDIQPMDQPAALSQDVPSQPPMSFVSIQPGQDLL